MNHTKRNSTISIVSLASLLLVFLLHAAILYGMWHIRLPQTSPQTVKLYAELIASPQAKSEEPEAPKVDLKAEPIPTPPEKPKIVKKVRPQPTQRQIASSAPVQPKEEYVAPAPTPEPIREAPEQAQKQETQAVAAADARPKQMPTGPVTLSSELSVSCPELSAPDYPALSRRLGEEGKLMLQVELDESGRISNTRIINSSGYSRLDNAAIAAVKNWRCKPAVRDGQPVRAIALQPFNFVIQGN